MVAQVVEAEFVVGGVEDVAGVGVDFGGWSQVGTDDGCEFRGCVFAFCGLTFFLVVLVEYEGMVVLLEAAYGEAHELVDRDPSTRRRAWRGSR